MLIHLTYRGRYSIFRYKQIRKMGMTKRLLEEIIDEELYSCDMDYEYEKWVENKQLQDQQQYMENYLAEKEAYEEMLADKY